jgi:nucleotide-binding universal stress UspA family protein
MKTILVPIDLADQHPDVALEEAIRLASFSDGTLILLNVMPSLPTYMAAEVPDDMIERSRVHTTHALDRLLQEKGMPATTRVVVREGHPGREILEYAQEIAADLIVMASHDPGASTYVFGSVAAYVVRHAHCSVYVVRPRHA